MKFSNSKRIKKLLAMGIAAIMTLSLATGTSYAQSDTSLDEDAANYEVRYDYDNETGPMLNSQGEPLDEEMSIVPLAGCSHKDTYITLVRDSGLTNCSYDNYTKKWTCTKEKEYRYNCFVCEAYMSTRYVWVSANPCQHHG